MSTVGQRIKFTQLSTGWRRLGSPSLDLSSGNFDSSESPRVIGWTDFALDLQGESWDVIVHKSHLQAQAELPSRPKKELYVNVQWLSLDDWESG
jgi:hypothetical protein